MSDTEVCHVVVVDASRPGVHASTTEMGPRDGTARPEGPKETRIGDQVAHRKGAATKGVPRGRSNDETREAWPGRLARLEAAGARGSRVTRRDCACARACAILLRCTHGSTRPRK